MLFLDTSALLMYEGFSTENPVCFSSYSLRELEDIKFHGKDEKLKAKARSIIRLYIAEPLSFICVNRKEKELEKWRKKFGFLPDNLDSRILLSAYALWREDPTITFLTADALQYSMAHTLGMTTAYMENEEKPQEPWKGWRDFYPTEEEMALLYGEPEKNTLGAITNEYCKIWENGELKDILRWSGERYEKLKYKEMKNSYTQEVLKPRNIEQKMAFDMLQNQNIKVKVLFSSWGSGKTLLALTYALGKVYSGAYRKIVFVRNSIITANSKDTGFLPGSLQEKMSIWNRSIADHVGGDEMMTQLEEQDVIETFPISHMRGRSLGGSAQGDGVICLVDEAENLTPQHITLLMSRIEETSEIIFCGDGKQCDFASHKMMGMYKMINALAGDPLFGAVELVKSERGPVPRLCDKIIPPR